MPSRPMTTDGQSLTDVRMPSRPMTTDNWVRTRQEHEKEPRRLISCHSLSQICGICGEGKQTMAVMVVAAVTLVAVVWWGDSGGYGGAVGEVAVAEVMAIAMFIKYQDKTTNECGTV